MEFCRYHFTSNGYNQNTEDVIALLAARGNSYLGNFCLKTALSWWDWTRLPQNGVTKAAVCNQAIIVGGQLLLPCLSTRTRSRGNTKLDFASGLLCRLSTFSKVIALAIGNYPFERIVRSRWWAGYSRCTCSCIKDPFSSLSLAAKRYPRDTGENWGKYSGNLAFSSLSWGSIALVCLEEENVRDPRECNNGRKTAALLQRQSLGCATSAHAFPGNISEHETSWVSDTSCI